MTTLFSIFQLITRPVRTGIKWYLKKPRKYHYHGIEILVLPGVFHPGFFHSTKVLFDFLEKQDLNRTSFLELGCGSGLLSILAANLGAIVTASDINEGAVRNVQLNASANEVTVNVVQSNLFDNLTGRTFDWIVINPPYYPRTPTTPQEFAWNCGEDHEYFKKLFSQLSSVVHDESRVLIIISDVCDFNSIQKIAQSHSWEFEKIMERRVLVDGKNTLYWLRSER